VAGRLLVLAVGKVKERGIREAIDDYYARVSRHYAVEEIELKDAPAAQLSPQLLRRTPPAAHVVALDVNGASRTSEGFARWLESRMTEGKGSVAFLIGGAEGLPSATIAAAHERVRLSTLTLPHRLARLVLAEQLYRAVTILRTEPYARI
jgi:23S rRNA (pseudouridine1915-N3)-methyltransferase